MRTLRTWAKAFRHTPLHPQWLLGMRRAPSDISHATGRILDIGAAQRWLQSQLPPSAHYTALDYPATGQALYAAHPDVFADAAHLPFPAACFDGVFCLEVLEHVPEPAKVMQEIARVLKHGGRAWISMPFLYPLHDAPFDFQRYTVFGLRRAAEQAGLVIQHLQPHGHALRTAGLLGCLALAGAVDAATGWRKWLLLLPTLLLIVGINLAAWGASRVWPNWPQLSQGHELLATKP